MTPLHQELKDLSKDRPAGYIDKNLFSYFTINKLIDTYERLKSIEIAAGNGQLSTSLRDVIWSSPNPTTKLEPSRKPTFPDTEVDLLISPSFDVVFDIFITGHPADKISEVTLSFNDVRAKIRAENNMIIFEGSDFDVKRNIRRIIGAEALLNAYGIDLIEAAHVEGHLGYGVVSQAVSASLSKRHEIQLSGVFPFVDFGKAIKLTILQGGRYLGIMPTDSFTLNTNARCGCNDGPDLSTSNSNLTTITNIPADPQPNDKLGIVAIGGPLPENKNPLIDFGPRSLGDGDVGVYIPQSFSEKLIGDPMPSITIPAQDSSGVIGYNGRANVAFMDSKVTFDLVGGGILLDIDLDINVTAYCDFEVFKGVRLPIGWAAIMPTKKGSIQMGFYPVVDKTGTLKLESTLHKCDMGEYVAVVIGVGTALKLLGVTAWIGFLVDVVLAGILSKGLPIVLKKEMTKYMAGREWKLIEGLPISNPYAKMYTTAPFDVTTDSLLASVTFTG